MDLKKILIGAGVAVLGYQAWKIFSKPKGEPKSNASGGTGGKPVPLKYNVGLGKVMRPYGTGFDARYVIAGTQPKPMDWFWLNDRWVWTKWNGQLEHRTIPAKFLIR